MSIDTRGSAGVPPAHRGWRWHYEPAGMAAPAYRLCDAPPSARGTIELYLPGATEEEFAEMRRRLIARFRPAFEVPATRFVPERLKARAGGHNSALGAGREIE